MARGPGRPDPEEQRAFAEAMRGARPLDRRSGRAVVVDPPPQPGAAASNAPARPDPAHGDARLETIERWGERYALLAAGADRRILRELAGAQPQDRLDLHGLDSARARRALRAFVESAHQRGARRLLVIHGRGHRSGPAGPILRDCFLDALAEAPLAARVLAVVSAPPALGGPGAALLLLRRRPR
jgi:DNA-nicking Smr family endonuclease